MKISPSKNDILLNKLVVNSIENNSGIFIGGNNICHGWSSHNKSNNGFGNISNVTINKCISVIYDNDLIDSPIIDKKKFLSIHSKQEASSTDIRLSDVNVNGMETNASVSIGDVDQVGWSSHSKNNIGEGNQKGITSSKNNRIFIHDNDQIDAPIQNHHYNHKSGE